MKSTVFVIGNLHSGLLNCTCLQLKPAGTLCRESSNSCDLPEFCSGASPHCPANVYLHDGHACHNVEGYCYNGICQTHEQQCITLWGPGKCIRYFPFYKIVIFSIFITVFSLFVFVCRSQTCPWDLLWESQLRRWPLWELWEGLQRLLCQMWCKVTLLLHWCSGSIVKYLCKTQLISFK